MKPSKAIADEVRDAGCDVRRPWWGLLRTDGPPVKYAFLYGLLTVCLLLPTACSDVGPSPTSTATRESPGPLDEARKQAAVDIVRQSGVVERIAGPQTWTASDFYQRPVGQTTGVYFVATWEQPVDYSGPWRILRCQGTRVVEPLGTWTGITQLSIVVDVENAEVVHYAAYGPPRVNPYQEAPQRPRPTNVGDASPEDQITVYDAESRKVIYEGPGKDGPQECPRGKEDD